MNRHWNSYLNRRLSRRELLRVLAVMGITVPPVM